MSSALFIVLERQVPGIDASSVSGKSLARQLEWLDRTAKELSVPPLSDFISVSPQEAAAFLEDEGQSDSGLRLPPEKWFDAAAGLRTVQALLTYGESQPRAEQHLLLDLKACGQVLERARQEDTRFHFAIDF